MEINALQLLDKLDKFRREHQNERQHPSDFCMRAMEAIVAEAAGYKSRVDWTEELKADASTIYNQDYNDPTYCRF